ncbi:hypothetical protein NMH_0478 [Neisseria meningitidis H44/76]|uniref:Uncharacterized protein n=1 Tax=Neisseria meningitidis serogroup B / serotype 15 (strain H44/76) TaxID=909420 RepID=E6MUN0_NEIMH|nr:hypothetical protein NMH_0478 [Neisseria meningitidis H44/76]
MRPSNRKTMPSDIVTHTFYHHFPIVLLRNGKTAAKSY